MYSVGLLVLYVMCESRDLFCRLRDNYVESDKEWSIKFREEPLVSFVIKMMNLEFNVFDAGRKWDEISNIVNFLSRSFLGLEIPSSCLDVQDNMDKCAINMADATLLDE